MGERVTVLVPERRRRLVALVARAGSARVAELAERLGVSEWTVRRDLDELERRGDLVRARGGAVLPALSPLQVLDPATSAAKRAIAAAAADLLDDDSTVMVLAGSTTGELVPLLAGRRMTVVTNGIEVAHALRNAPGITLVVIGGYLHRQQMTLLGPMSEQGMQELHVDVIVAGAFGVDAELGVTGDKIIQAGYHHGMLRHTNALMVLADRTKLGRRGPTVLAPPDAVDVLVTDAPGGDATVVALRTSGTRVVSV